VLRDTTVGAIQKMLQVGVRVCVFVCVYVQRLVCVCMCVYEE
jgi:hypothetical protein